MYIFCVYMHACIQHAHATAHVEIRGQLLEASSLSPLWNLGNNRATGKSQIFLQVGGEYSVYRPHPNSQLS